MIPFWAALGIAQSVACEAGFLCPVRDTLQGCILRLGYELFPVAGSIGALEDCSALDSPCI